VLPYLLEGSLRSPLSRSRQLRGLLGFAQMSRWLDLPVSFWADGALTPQSAVVLGQLLESCSASLNFVRLEEGPAGGLLVQPVGRECPF